MSASPTARALRECKRREWPAYVTEKHNAFSGKKSDAFGFGDLLAIDGEPGSLLIQVTSTSNMSARRTKILTECNVLSRAWLEAGNRISVWGYSRRVHRNKDGSKSKVKRWALRVVPVTLVDFEGAL